MTEITSEMMGDGITLVKETALRLKQLELKFENLEADVKFSDCCFNELNTDQEEAGNKIDMVEKRVTLLEVDLEERGAAHHSQNVELRNHINLLIDMINNITRVLNGNIEQAGVDEVDGTQTNEEQEENEPTQLTVEQVYDMYQSQPRDEEGWLEMSKAIKAAEEYEAGLKEQQERVNGLTEDEWNDLLRI